MLATVLILILLLLMLNTGVDLAGKSYRKMVSESETQVLLSTVTTALADELRYARDVRWEQNTGQLKTYTSISYGHFTELSIGDKGQLVANKTKKMLPTAVYGQGDYQVTKLEITYDAENSVFHMDVGISDGEGIGAETTMDVQCLN
jgi:hypothetical protein